MSQVTATLFCIYTLGIFGYVCQELLNKVLYLTSKYRYTVLGTIAVVLLKPICNLIVHNRGAVAVATVTTVLFTIYAVCILIAIRKVIGNYMNKALAGNLGKILLAGIAAFATYLLTTRLHLPMQDSKIGFVLPLALCAIVYGIVLLCTGSIKYIIQNKENPQ